MKRRHRTVMPKRQPSTGRRYWLHTLKNKGGIIK
nr:MAG TPA: hypothetical protein [Caudoviricetes sp.]